MAGCGNDSKFDENSMCFSNIEYIEKFQKEFITHGDSVVFQDCYGALNIRAFDSLMIIHTEDKQGFWKCYSLNNHKYLGSILECGHSSLEMTDAPDCRDAQLFIQNGEICCFLTDYYTGKMIVVNISKSLREGKTNGICCSQKVHPNSATCLLLDSLYDEKSMFLTRELEPVNGYGKLIYYKNGAYIGTDESLDILNSFELEKKVNINAITSAFGYNSKLNKIVQMPYNINCINVFSDKSSQNKTIVFGDNIIDPNSYCRNGEYAKHIFEGLQMFDNFFTVKGSRGLRNSVFFFDYEYNPLCELKIELDSANLGMSSYVKMGKNDMFPYSFCTIDYNGKTLYYKSWDDGKIISCNISDVIDYVKKKTNE